MGQFNPKIHWTIIMYRLTALLFVAAVSAAPLEDTADVAAAKAEFKAAFDMTAAGHHAQLAPVNNDVQAEQIANAYLDDSADVATAKAEFKAAFDNVAAGGLAAMQEPAPVHTLPAAPVVYNALPYAAVNHYAAHPYLTSYHHFAAYPYAAYPYTYPVVATNVVKSE